MNSLKVELFYGMLYSPTLPTFVFLVFPCFRVLTLISPLRLRVTSFAHSQGFSLDHLQKSLDLEKRKNMSTKLLESLSKWAIPLSITIAGIQYSMYNGINFYFKFILIAFL